jgi:4-hydroxy-tetrahydrodipicolinate synthase
VKALEQKISTQEIDLWKKACDTLFIAANPVPVKNLMQAQGKIKTNILRAPLDYRDLADNAPVLLADKNIQNWYKENA